MSRLLLGYALGLVTLPGIVGALYAFFYVSDTIRARRAGVTRATIQLEDLGKKGYYIPRIKGIREY